VSLTRKSLPIFALAAIALSFTAFAAIEKTSVQERIAPVGQVCMAGEDCAATVVASADTGPRSGQVVYETKCVACHGTGAAGAPKLGDVAAWAPRIDKGLETLNENAWNGFNAMPAKGLCMDCTREEMDAAVNYMAENSQ
jgi:cytochrome c5